MAETRNVAPTGPGSDVLMLLCHVRFPSKIMKLLPFVSVPVALLIFRDPFMGTPKQFAKGRVEF